MLRKALLTEERTRACGPGERWVSPGTRLPTGPHRASWDPVPKGEDRGEVAVEGDRHADVPHRRVPETTATWTCSARTAWPPACPGSRLRRTSKRHPPDSSGFGKPVTRGPPLPDGWPTRRRRWTPLCPAGVATRSPTALREDDRGVQVRDTRMLASIARHLRAEPGTASEATGDSRAPPAWRSPPGAMLGSAAPRGPGAPPLRRDPRYAAHRRTPPRALPHPHRR